MTRFFGALGRAVAAVALVAGCTGSGGTVDEEDAGGGVTVRDAGFRRGDGGANGGSSSTGGPGSSLGGSSGGGSSSRASSSVGGASSLAASGGASSAAGVSSSRAGSSSSVVGSSSRPASSSVGGASSVAVSSSSRPASSSAVVSSSSAAVVSSSSVVASSSSAVVSSSFAPPSSSQGGSSSSGGLPPTAYAWAHTPTTLYRVNMADFTLEAAWFFVFRNEDGSTRTDQEMVDIALSSAGEMYGVSWNPAQTGTGTHHLYRIAVPTTVGVGQAVATRVGQLSWYYNALAFAPAGTVRPTEVLIALDNETQLAQSFMDILDTTNGTTTVVGGLGNDLKSSGDVVAINGLGIFAAVKDTAGTNFLASLSNVGTATILGGDLGFTNVWGLAYWDGVLLGYTQAGQVLSINPVTGAATLVWDYNNPEVPFYGAAVSPNVPLMVP